MRQMKDSGINYIGNIPTDWKCGKIKHIVSSPIVTGAIKFVFEPMKLCSPIIVLLFLNPS